MITLQIIIMDSLFNFLSSWALYASKNQLLELALGWSVIIIICVRAAFDIIDCLKTPHGKVSTLKYYRFTH